MGKLLLENLTNYCYSIQYNNWNVELTTLQAFNEQCRKKLMIAKENYHSKIDAYLKLQNTEFKHGFWGFLTSEQKQFNKEDRKSTRLNSSHVRISYAVFC